MARYGKARIVDAESSSINDWRSFQDLTEVEEATPKSKSLQTPETMQPKSLILLAAALQSVSVLAAPVASGVLSLSHFVFLEADRR
jgi:hypothetical protein